MTAKKEENHIECLRAEIAALSKRVDKNEGACSHRKQNMLQIVEAMSFQYKSIELSIQNMETRERKKDDAINSMAVQIAASAEIHKSNQKAIDGIATKSWGILIVLVGSVAGTLLVFLLNK